MEDEKTKNFAFGLAITLGTIVLGLISYIFFTSNTLIKKDAPRCEYYGWAYADKEIFDSKDGCNTCFCHTGEIVCTKETCTKDTPEKEVETNN